MRLIVTLLNVMPLYVVNYELNEWWTNMMDKQLIKFIFNVITAMTLISYFVASFVKPPVIPVEAHEGRLTCIHCKN
jgi:ABC-type sulfate transport system permease subunit